MKENIIMSYREIAKNMIDRLPDDKIIEAMAETDEMRLSMRRTGGHVHRAL